MANNIKKIYRGAVNTSESTLFTVGASAQVVVTNILLTNTTATAVTATVKFGDVEVLSGVSVSANGVLAIDIRQALDALETIKATASAAGVSAACASAARKLPEHLPAGYDAGADVYRSFVDVMRADGGLDWAAALTAAGFNVLQAV
jgi:hypothetical protein